MTIYSALYYPGSLARGDLIVRDNRFYPGKYAESFAVWWQYLRRHYPDVPVMLFCDESSPVPISPLLDVLPDDGRVTICWLDQFSGQYFRPMQRNLVEAISDAYNREDDMLWIDADCFCNTDVRPLVVGYDFAAPQIAHHQMTADSVFTYISTARLHAYDRFAPLPNYLSRMVNEGPTETRMHSLQEGGLYKLFCFGKTRVLGPHLDLSHLSCYSHFMEYLRANPLNTPEYAAFVSALESFDMTRLEGVDLTFHDMYFSTKENKR